jgi:hypothetical protein
LHVEKYLIRGFNGPSGASGINFAPNSAAELHVTDTIIADTGNGALPTSGAILIRPTGAGSASAVLRRVQVQNSANVGILVDGSASTNGVKVSLSDSSSTANGNEGVVLFTTAGQSAVTMMLDRVLLANNSVGIRSTGPNVFALLGGSVISGNGTGVLSQTGATTLSYKNNQINGNAVDGTPLTQTPLN